MATSGQIQTKSGVTLDHEADDSYAVTVKTEDGHGGSATIAVTITVTDVAEQPETPAAPTVTATSGSTTSLDVAWTAPGRNGGPALTGYKLRYRKGSGNWTEPAGTETGTSAMIGSLDANSSYQVQVRALNGETPSAWSPSGTGSTRANSAPTFANNMEARSVAENTAAGQNVGAVVTATDTDVGDTLSYSLEGTDAASFDIVSTSGSGQIQTKAALDHETDASYSVTVKADDGNGGSATVPVTITVTDVAEQPETPAAPTVAATANTTTSLDVSWTAPGLNGGPALTGYQLRYRKGSGSWTEPAGTETGTSVTIGSLDVHSDYQVQVRALNGETPSAWSPAGTGSTGNSLPVFGDTPPVGRSVAENAAPETNVGAVVAATDADTGDTVSYSLEGTDAAEFDIVATSGQIQTKSGVTLDHEADDSYAVTVKTEDGHGGSATIAVTITVTDVAEQPETPAAPTVTATSGSTTSLDVAWTAPGRNGGPALTGYKLRYRKGSGNWTEPAGTETGTSAMIGSLDANSSYQVQVRALNGETPSAWSPSGTGSTRANSAPTFANNMEARSVAENTAAGQNVGAVVTATDTDVGDTLSYSLEGTDAASFDIVSTSGSGQIQTKAALDHETDASYSVTVKADDGNGGSATVPVTITVTDVAEQPETPAAPTVAATANTTTSLDVSWTAPGLNGGPALTGYQLRYRKGSGSWTEPAGTETGTSATIGSLDVHSDYQVQVRALNGETPSAWSPAGTGSTGTPNSAPVFANATATREVPENTAENTNIGTALPAATDADNDPLTYTLEGADAASFGFDPATRQLSTESGVTYDRETQSSYAVTLKADDDNGGTDTIAVTITLTNVIEPPDRPAAPSVSSVDGNTTSLSVNWTTPSNSGPAIDNYDLQYREGSSGSWINGPQNVSGTSATIGSLTANTLYQVQVLATNAEGDSPWSLPGSGQTGALGAPDVPHSLDATPGNRQVMLGWVQPSGGAEVTDYEYELDLSGTWISTGSTDTDYTVRNLTNGQSYTFKVRAANSAGQSAASTASASVTPATVPGAPTGLSATVSDQRVDLIWTAPASNGGQSITDYEYEQGGSGTWISTGSTATSYTVRNLTNGQPYRFRVRAVNSVGAGAASAASPNVMPATEPDAPTGLSATVSDQEVDLIWTAPASNGGATILRYEYELDFSGTWTSTGGTATSYTVTGLTNGQTYRFRVRAVNRVGAGLATSSRSATPTSTVVAPDTPSSLSATPGNRQVMLSWVQPSGGAALTHYEYEQDAWTSTGGKAPSYTVTGLTNGQTYTFRVRAVNSAGASAASSSRTATPTTTEPEAPESLSFTPGDQQVTLRWRAPTNDGGEPITHYEYEQDGSGIWISTGGTATSHTVTGLNNGQTYMFRVRAVNALGNGAVVTLEATPSPSTGRGGGGGGGGPRITWPGAPENLLAEGGDGQVKLTWEAPEDDGGSEITDYQYRINGRNPWTSIGSTQTTHTLTGLVNGTAYVFEVRAVNRIGRGRASNRAEATPEAPEVFTLDFAHFANGTGITSDLVLVNVAPHPIRPAIYFYDRGGHLIDPESVVDVTGDLEVAEDGSLSGLTEMAPLGQLTISTHGQGELVSGSVKVLSDGPIGGGVRYGLPEIGVAGVGASLPVRDVLFPARRQEGGIRTATALHNLEAEAMGVNCRLMSGGVSLEEVEIPLEANGQASWFIEEAFPTTDTSDFLGSVRCTVLGSRRFTAIAVEMDAAQRIFNTLSVVPLDRTGDGNKQTTLNFAHFVNGTWITDLVFVNLSTEASRPAPTPFHTDILPSRPAIYFYDTEGNPIAAESVVDITGDLEITEDGALTVQSEMEPLGVLTISTHGRGELVSGSARVVSDGPIGGMLRFEHPDFGVAGVGASPPVSDALFPVRRQEGGITTGVALHNLESSPGLLRCDLMREGVLLDAASIPLEANGQTSWLIDQAFPAADTSDFAGSVRCDAVGEGLFSAVALEMDPVNRIFATLPVVPVPERMDRE